MGKSFIHWPVAAVAFVVGLTFALASRTDKIPVTVFPTPDNAGKIEYVDRAGTCHVFRAQKTECGKNPPPKEIPAQFD
jgi:hypothetical protein